MAESTKWGLTIGAASAEIAGIIVTARGAIVDWLKQQPHRMRQAVSRRREQLRGAVDNIIRQLRRPRPKAGNVYFRGGSSMAGGAGGELCR